MEIIELDPLTEFFDAIRSPLTKDRYGHRFDMFLKHIGIGEGNLKRLIDHIQEQWAEAEDPR